METAESLPSGSVALEATATVEGSAIYHPASEVGSENPSHGESVAPVAVPPPAAPAAHGVVSLAVVAPVKKKRGRPRKYGPDGSVLAPLESLSAPSRRKYSAVRMKRGGGRPLDFTRSSQTWFEVESLGPAGYERTENVAVRTHFHVNGDMMACFAGANFTPHVITVAAGEDVTLKIISFSQQGPRAICILSANGVISNVTLRQPDSSGGTLTYEGRFELLSLSGSFMPTDNGGTRSRHGGMSVSLASPDRRVIGGSVAGLLVAASPVQVVVGSFIPGYQMEQKTKRPKHETTLVSTTVAGDPISSVDAEVTCDIGQVQQRNSVTPKPILAASASFRGENWTSSTLHSVQETRNSATDISLALQSG